MPSIGETSGGRLLEENKISTESRKTDDWSSSSSLNNEEEGLKSKNRNARDVAIVN